MKFSIVLSTHPAQFQAATFKGDLEANLTLIASQGYDGVELAIRDPKLIDLDELAYLIQTNRLEVPAIGTGQAWSEEGLSFTNPDKHIRRKAIERILTHIPVAARFKAIIIIGLIRGVVMPGVEQEQAMVWLVESLIECCQAAQEQSVRLALEPINRYETALINSVAEGLVLVKKVKLPNFGLLLDTFHMNIEEPQIEKSIRMCGEHIFHFHVADSNRWFPGAGHLDFRSILQTLQSSGYQAYLSGEFLPNPDVKISAWQNIRYFKTLMEEMVNEKDDKGIR
jgi:sugar phosphate isomerase/epimerase